MNVFFYLWVKVADSCMYILLESTMTVFLMTAHKGHINDDCGDVGNGEERY